MSERPVPTDFARLADACAELSEVRLAWLFGSQASATPRPGSDVDVAVLVDDQAVRDADARRATIWRLAGSLGREVGSHRLDLVLLNDAPPLLRHRVLSSGLLLFERSPEERVRYVRRTLREVQDFQVRRDWFLRRRIERLKGAAPVGGSPDLLEKARGVARLLREARGVS
jgi:uncharacterized protein